MGEGDPGQKGSDIDLDDKPEAKKLLKWRNFKAVSL